MSPTLYTAKNNGKKNNGGNMTIRISITMANNGIGTERDSRVHFQVSIVESSWKLMETLGQKNK